MFYYLLKLIIMQSQSTQLTYIGFTHNSCYKVLSYIRKVKLIEENFLFQQFVPTKKPVYRNLLFLINFIKTRVIIREINNVLVRCLLIYIKLIYKYCQLYQFSNSRYLIKKKFFSKIYITLFKSSVVYVLMTERANFTPKSLSK